MRFSFKRTTAAVFLVLSITAPVMAASGGHGSSYDDGVTAYGWGDYAAALRIFRKLAQQGDAAAQNDLGIMNEKGKGVAQNYVKAAKWYRLAADQGAAAAQFNLGLLYAKGQGVPQDYVLAHMWFSLAAAQGNKAAEKNRSKAARLMTIAQIVKAQRLARDRRSNEQPPDKSVTFDARWYYPY